VKVAALGTSQGPGELGVQPTINAAADTRFYVFDPTIEPGRVMVFDGTGRFLTMFGRSGRGPGEYSRPRHVIAHRDSLHVIDVLQYRVTTLSADYKVQRVDQLPLAFPRYVRFPDGSYLVNGGLQTRDAVGLPFHLLDGSLRIVRSFGADDPTVIPGQRWRQERVLAQASDSLFWAAPTNRFAVELWGTDGRLRRRIERRAAWFAAWTETGGLPRLTPPKPRVAGLHQDERGRLWVMVHVADANWAPGSQSLNERVLEYPEQARYFDTIVEVWDPSSARLITSTRFDEHLHPFIGRGMVFSARLDGGGIPYYDVWRLEISPPRER
jgi:hypothetical protein